MVTKGRATARQTHYDSQVHRNSTVCLQAGRPKIRETLLIRTSSATSCYHESSADIRTVRLCEERAPLRQPFRWHRCPSEAWLDVETP